MAAGFPIAFKRSRGCGPTRGLSEQIDSAMQTPPFGVPAGTRLEDTLEVVRADIEQRLRSTCQGWSEEDFQTLVDDATLIAMKYVVTDPRKSRDG